jgi:uncharacterized protein
MPVSQHPIVWVEIPSADRSASSEFYSSLFGWQIDNSMESMNYTMFSTGTGPGGGFPELADGFEAGDVMILIGTHNIDESLARAEALGGKTVIPRTEIPGNGWYGVFEDPTGNNIGLFTGLEDVGE